MRQHLLDLYAIQQIDLGIRDLEKRREALPATVNQFDAKITKLKAELDELTGQRDTIDGEAKALESNMDAENHKIRKWEKRLSDIRNQREYLALSREVEGAKRAVRNAEERLTELRSTRGELTTRIDELQDQLAEQEVDRDEETHRVDGSATEIAAEITAETKRREALVPTIPKNLYRTYEFVRAKRFGLGIVPVVGGCCQGCNMRLPPQLFNTLQRVSTLEQCPSCQRVVFWDGILPAEDEGAAESNVEESVSASP